MSRKIAWITTLVTLVYWLGNAMGCSGPADVENYRVLEEDREMFNPNADPDKPGARAEGPSNAAMAQLDPFDPGGQDPFDRDPFDDTLDDTLPPPVLPERPMPREGDIEPLSTGSGPGETMTVTPFADDAPSLRGIDRSHWSTILVAPAYQPPLVKDLMFEDVPIWHRYPEVLEADNLKDAVDAALAGAQAEGWDARNAGQVLLQPAKFGLDLVLAPLHLARAAVKGEIPGYRDGYPETGMVPYVPVVEVLPPDAEVDVAEPAEAVIDQEVEREAVQEGKLEGEPSLPEVEVEMEPEAEILTPEPEIEAEAPPVLELEVAPEPAPEETPAPTEAQPEPPAMDEAATEETAPEAGTDAVEDEPAMEAAPTEGEAIDAEPAAEEPAEAPPAEGNEPRQNRVPR